MCFAGSPAVPALQIPARKAVEPADFFCQTGRKFGREERMRRGAWSALGLAGALLLAAPAAADALGDLIAAAGKEGSLRLMWGEGSLGGTNGARLIQDALNKKFGTKIRVEFSPGGSMGMMANQLMAEVRAG